MLRPWRPLLRLRLAAPTSPGTAHPLPRPRNSTPFLRPAATWPISLSRPEARFASSSSKPPPPERPVDGGKHAAAGETLEKRPDKVSSSSSVRQVFESPPASVKDDADMGRELRHDIAVFRDTFRLSAVPRESRILGLAGTLPYMATSLSTLFLAWDLDKEMPTGNALFDAVLINHDTAQHLLSLIEPLQLGYGAVIISFLGAIHWGLEYAEKQPSPKRTRFRYGIGVAASVVAWPTLLMPIEYALTTQFMAFVALYFVDSRSAVRGWAPSWYGTYRFLLTAMVGLAILVSLVGRAKISSHGRLSSGGLRSSMTNSGIADHKTDWAKLEAEEKDRLKKEKEQAEKKARKEAEKAEKEASKNKAQKTDHTDKGADDDKADKQDGNKGSKGTADEEKDAGTSGKKQ